MVIVDTGALRVDRRIRMKGKNPEHAVFSPDGKWLYVSAEEADSVDIVDLEPRLLYEISEPPRAGRRVQGEV